MGGGRTLSVLKICPDLFSEWHWRTEELKEAGTEPMPGLGSLASSLCTAFMNPQLNLSLAQFKHDGRLSSHYIFSLSERIGFLENLDADLYPSLFTFVTTCSWFSTRPSMAQRLAICVNFGLRKIDIKLRKSKAAEKSIWTRLRRCVVHFLSGYHCDVVKVKSKDAWGLRIFLGWLETTTRISLSAE